MNSDDSIRSVGEYAGLIRRRWPILAAGVADARGHLDLRVLVPPAMASAAVELIETANSDARSRLDQLDAVLLSASQTSTSQTSISQTSTRTSQEQT